MVGSEEERPPTAFVVAGPSGVGKGTIMEKMKHALGARAGFSVSHTSRPMRQGEEDGVHYHFASRDEIEERRNKGEFLETAEVHGNLYGTSLEAVERVARDGRICLLDIDVQGAESVRSSDLDAVLAFVEPPSSEELERRLRRRGTDAPDTIAIRLRNASRESERARASGIFDAFVVNEDAQEAARDLVKLLAPRCPSLAKEALERLH